MTTRLIAKKESWPIRGAFTLSRGTRTVAEVVVCRIGRDGHAGLGECVPYARYGESVDSVLAQIGEIAPAIEKGAARDDIMAADGTGRGAQRRRLRLMGPGGQADRRQGRTERICAAPPRPLPTCFTISLDTPDEMARHARAHAERPLLKVKLGGNDTDGGGDADASTPSGPPRPARRIILDANEGWREDNIAALMAAAAEAAPC